LQELDTTPIDEYAHNECGYQQIEVTGKDYEFVGLDEVSGGKTSVEFTNDGAEVHEIILARKNDGVTETFDEILELPEEESISKVTIFGPAIGPPGSTSYMLADLEPGEYVALCFIPQGMTSFEQEPPEAPPHVALGMKQEFAISE
jgi:hypothetical protein